MLILFGAMAEKPRRLRFGAWAAAIVAALALALIPLDDADAAKKKKRPAVPSFFSSRCILSRLKVSRLYRTRSICS